MYELYYSVQIQIIQMEQELTLDDSPSSLSFEVQRSKIPLNLHVDHINEQDIDPQLFTKTAENQSSLNLFYQKKKVQISNKRNKRDGFRIQQIIRRHRVDSLVRQFSKKIKKTIRPKQWSNENIQFIENQQIKKSQFIFSKNAYFEILLIIALQNLILVLVSCFSIFLKQIQKFQVFYWYMIISLLVHAAQIFLKLYFKNDCQEYKKEYKSQFRPQYLISFDFLYDLIVIACLFIQIMYFKGYILRLISKLVICFKIKNVLKFKFYDKVAEMQKQRFALSKLPVCVKYALSKKKYIQMLQDKPFFKYLKQSTLLGLSKQIQKTFKHPGQLVYFKGNSIPIMIFNDGKFGFCYRKGNSYRNGEAIHQFQVGKDQYKLATLNFFYQNSLPYDVKSLDYTTLYFISMQNMLKVLKMGNYNYDYEYYFMQKDSNKYLKDEYQNAYCKFCHQHHTLFDCKKCHYIPIKMLKIAKYLKKKAQKYCKQNHTLQPLKEKTKQYRTKIIRKKLKMKIQYKSLLQKQDINGQFEVFQEFKWIQVDKAHNFMFYFTRFNPKNLQQRNFQQISTVQ